MLSALVGDPGIGLASKELVEGVAVWPLDIAVPIGGLSAGVAVGLCTKEVGKLKSDAFDAVLLWTSMNS